MFFIFRGYSSGKLGKGFSIAGDRIELDLSR